MRTSIMEEAEAIQPDVALLRRRIHRHPEVGLDLPRTQDAVLEALDGVADEVRTGTATTSVVAFIDGAHPGPTVLLRGDMDALPMPEDTGLDFASEVDGVMHACGHDSHVAMLAGAARLLATRREELHGSVLLMFQPGEEGYFGARVMIDEGLLEAADGRAPPSAAFALHVGAHLPAGHVSTRAGAIGASADRIEITVRGRGGHASAPHRVLDPVPVACQIVQALQTMVTRTVDVFDPAVLTIGSIHAGTTNNVIPETAVMLGTVRTLSDGTRTGVLERARRVAEGIAEAHGLEADLSVEEGYPPTINDAAMADLALDVAAELLGSEPVSRAENPQMGAEDFSYVLQRVPGAMLRLGVAPPGVERPASNHSNRMMLHEPAMATGVALHASLALRVLDA